MPTRSRLGTVTWVDPEFYISYDIVTGRITSIGPPLDGHPSFKISTDEAVAFTSGKLNSIDYRVIKKDQQYLIVKQDQDLATGKIYPIKSTDDVFPKVTVIRNSANKLWKVSKIVAEPIFVFVCKKESPRHYIRTLNIIDQTIEVPMIYNSELGDVDLYVQENYSVIKFYDQ